MNLKKKIRELQTNLSSKQEELEQVKKNIKSTKLAEVEVEMKNYVDECTRLRQQLEEVIRSKDAFADPDEMKAVQDRFQQQEAMLNQLRAENN